MKMKELFSLPYTLLFGYDIFISYTRQGSRDYAARLYEQLTSLDYSCFIDKKEVPGGRSLNSSLTAALRGSKTLILVGTARALQRDYMRKEFGEFASSGRPIIPINVASALNTHEILNTRPWDTKTWGLVAVLRGHTGLVFSAEFSPDSNAIVTASADGTARIYPKEMFFPFAEVLLLARQRITRTLTIEEKQKYLHNARGE